MDAPVTHNFSNTDFSFVPSTEHQFLQFLPNSPNSHSSSFGEIHWMPAHPVTAVAPSTPPISYHGCTLSDVAPIDAGGSSPGSDPGLEIHKELLAANQKRAARVRHQHMKSERRRREDLRVNLARLQDALPALGPAQKESKASLVDRATSHIHYLELTQQQLHVQVFALEMQVKHLHQTNSK